MEFHHPLAFALSVAQSPLSFGTQKVWPQGEWSHHGAFTIMTLHSLIAHSHHLSLSSHVFITALMSHEIFFSILNFLKIFWASFLICCFHFFSLLILRFSTLAFGISDFQMDILFSLPSSILSFSAICKGLSTPFLLWHFPLPGVIWSPSPRHEPVPYFQHAPLHSSLNILVCHLPGILKQIWFHHTKGLKDFPTFNISSNFIMKLMILASQLRFWLTDCLELHLAYKNIIGFMLTRFKDIYAWAVYHTHIHILPWNTRLNAQFNRISLIFLNYW